MSILDEIESKAHSGLEDDNSFATRGLYLTEIVALIAQHKTAAASTVENSEHLDRCPFCNGNAELQEWEERDSTRWAARVHCTACGASGRTGYANNHMGCYDAVNDLHKERALLGWNCRPAVDHEALEADGLAEIAKLAKWHREQQRSNEGYAALQKQQPNAFFDEKTFLRCSAFHENAANLLKTK